MSSNILVLIALICVVSGIVHDFDENSRNSFTDWSNSIVQWPSKLCENKTLAHSIQIQIREVITNLESNGSYTKILKKFSKSIKYIKNDNNRNILLSNCIEYYNGLNKARRADRKADELQQYYQENVNRLLRQILFPVIGSFGFNFLT